LNDSLLKVDVQLYTRAKELAVILEALDYNDIRFQEGTTRENIVAFVSDLAKGVRKDKDALKGKSYGAIIGQAAKGGSASAFRFEPDRLAIWLYAGLTEVVEQLFVAYQQGKTPSLLPLRRSLQMIIDSQKEHNGIYQMLSAFRNPEEGKTEASFRVAIAIDIIGFALFLERSNIDILELALAAILSGLEKTDDADKTVAPLFAFGGLGESALGLVVYLYESKKGREGKSISVQGQMLLVVEEYHVKIRENPKTPLPKIIYSLLNETSFASPLLQIFARYKGPFPIGSFVKVDNETMLVIGQSNNKGGKQRPIVMKIEKGRLIKSIDLSKKLDKKITQISSLAEQDVVLEDLVM